MKAVDLFAGAGGFTEGARMAGVEVAWAANHWPMAVAFHGRNHPGTEHSCQDLQQADWREVPDHDVLLASPACQGHSLARGKERPHHDALRSTAWAVVACAEYHRSRVVVVENVPEFRNWILYSSWLGAMYQLGYAVAPHLIDAADHGVPQHRKRLFLPGLHPVRASARAGHAKAKDGGRMRMPRPPEVRTVMGFRDDCQLPAGHQDSGISGHTPRDDQARLKAMATRHPATGRDDMRTYATACNTMCYHANPCDDVQICATSCGGACQPLRSTH